jgi:hypothetical protein
MKLSTLSNQDLLLHTDRLAARERELTLEVIDHLREVLRRRAFVEAGYSSLWDYVTQGLKYSDGAAKRRIDALHALREHPELASAVSAGALNLSTVSRVQSFVRHRKLAKPERLELFQTMCGKSAREVERELVRIDPEAPRPEQTRMVSESQVELRFSVSVELLEKLKRLQGLCAHRLKDAGSYAELLALLAELGIRELDPGKAAKRGVSSNISGGTSTSKLRGSRDSHSSPPTNRRFIPAALRRAVWQKAQGRCTHQDPATQRRCGSRFALQIEHIRPFALGGSSTDATNLTLLCRQHNLYRAVQVFGPAAIPRKDDS